MRMQEHQLVLLFGKISVLSPISWAVRSHIISGPGETPQDQAPSCHCTPVCPVPTANPDSSDNLGPHSCSWQATAVVTGAGCALAPEAASAYCRS